MSIEEEVLQFLMDSPGTARAELLRVFGLSDYRLNRVFRHLKSDMPGRAIVDDGIHGVRVMEVLGDRCDGIEWQEAPTSAYEQCSMRPELPDGRCYAHSRYENPEMIAFKRRLAYLLGPSEPSVRFLLQLTLVEVEELLQVLEAISPMTLFDQVNKRRLVAMHKVARATLIRTREMRRERTGFRVPPEFEARHRRSSGNTFEYSIRRNFAALELGIDATREEVLKAWRKLARRFHPDAQGGDEEKMKEINLAKEKIFRIRRWD
jgi:hypothetical protein